jgi:beta-lactamase regulating signal transducer with metallopeptidase domain
VAIVNWLVQGCIVAALTAAVLRFLQNVRAQARYTFCWGALALVLALPLITFVHMLVALAPTVAGGVAISGPLISVPTDSWKWMIALTISCAVWSAVRGLQFASAISALRRARRDCRAFPSMVESGLHHWTNIKERGRRARLMLSDDVRAAAVLSGPSPIIAVSPSVLDHLTAEEVDLLVVHEWAHVQRRDDAAHLVQVICRMVAGWHPAVSWLNARLHDERESACDEIAVVLSGSPKAYAACLLKLAALPSINVKPLPAVGALSSSGLAARVRRIVSARRFVSRRWSSNAVAASTVLLAAVSSTVAAVRIVETAAVPPTAEPRVEAIDRQGGVLSNLGSRRTSDAAATAKQTELARGPVNTTPRRIMRSANPSGEQTVDRRGVVTAPPTGALRSTSARAEVSEARPLSIVAPISIEPPSIAQSSAPRQSDDAPSPAAGETGPVPPWTAAANAGRAVGQGWKNAGVGTAGFFARVGKRIAGSF